MHMKFYAHLLCHMFCLFIDYPCSVQLICVPNVQQNLQSKKVHLLLQQTTQEKYPNISSDMNISTRCWENTGWQVMRSTSGSNASQRQVFLMPTEGVNTNNDCELNELKKLFAKKNMKTATYHFIQFGCYLM